MSNVYEQEAKRRGKSKDLRPLRRLLPFLSSYKPQVVMAFIALLVASVATLVIPVAVRRVFDHGFTGENAGLVDQYFGVMLAVVALLAVGSAVRFYFVTWIGERVVADVRDALFRHLTLLTPSYYESQKTGEVISRLTADTTQIKSAFSSTASIALRNVVMLIGALVMMVYTSPKLSGLAALAIPLIVLPLVLYGRRVRSLSRLAQDTLADSAAFAQERLSAISTVQSNTQEAATMSAFAGATRTAFDAAAQRTLARGVLTFLIILVSLGAIVGLLWFGARDVMAGKLSGGTLSQFVLYAVFAASSLGQLSEVYGEVQLAAGAAERISELLDEKPAIVSPASATPIPSPAQGLITFKGVSFQYPTRPGIDVLKKLSFVARPGEVVAIVGPSGAGKTTIFSLLQRFYDPQAGVVSIDDVPLTGADLTSLRSVIATVPQDPVIFSGSVNENIRFGRPGATMADVESAAKAARADGFIKALPQGYETPLGERGVTLSGGQRQRIAIARAILRNAPILLLDEATSALDAESEQMIQQALETVTQNRTTLVIAHRLATVRNADRILVLDKGKLVAQGTHAELVKKNELYARLAKLQFSGPSA
ncbi:MAG: ATP-binding cassette domain-containing protein [Rhizobiales bacterium]|nr:ATP-binding cassette domain-containing protein [Hyphomicrobiales bacterium]